MLLFFQIGVNIVISKISKAPKTVTLLYFCLRTIVKSLNCEVFLRIKNDGDIVRRNFSLFLSPQEYLHGN